MIAYSSTVLEHIARFQAVGLGLLFQEAGGTTWDTMWTKPLVCLLLFVQRTGECDSLSVAATCSSREVGRVLILPFFKKIN